MAGAIAYSNSFNVPFLFDDVHNIQESRGIRVESLSPRKLLRSGSQGLLKTRPVAYVSFALNYWWDRYEPAGYHAVNLLIHIACAIVLFFWLAKTIELIDPERQSRGRYLSFCVALLWLLHPVQTQTVTYIVQRMNSLATFFYLSALLLYLNARLAESLRSKGIFFTGCVACGLLALGSKEIAATLPFFILLYEWYFLQELDIEWLKRKLPVLALVVVCGFVTIWLYLGSDPLQVILASYEKRSFTPFERILTEFRVVVFYLFLLIFPHPGKLNLLHDFSLSHSMFVPFSTFPALLAIPSMLGFAVWIAKKHRLLSFAIIWYLGNLVIESSIVGLEIIFEHRLYLPSIGFFIVAGALLARFVRPCKVRWALLGLLCTVLGAWTFQRNTIWQDPVRFWQDTVAKSPKNARAHNNLGARLVAAGRFDEGIEALKKSLLLDQYLAAAHLNLGAAYLQSGNVGSAIAHLQNTSRIMHDSPHLLNLLAKAHMKNGNFIKASALLQRTIAKSPDFAQAYNTMGLLHLKEEQNEAALKAFQKAVALDKTFVEALNNLGQAFFLVGAFKKGIDTFQRALQIEPGHHNAIFNLARAYELTGKKERALDQYERFIQKKTDDAMAFHHAGVLSIEIRKEKNVGLRFLERALEINPAYSKAREARAILTRYRETTH